MRCDASPRHQRALQDRGTPGSPEKPISVADVFFHFRLFRFFSTEAATTSNATETHSPVLAVFHRTCSGRGSRPSGLVGFGEFPPPPSTYVFSLARVSTVRGGSRRACVCRRVIAVLLRVRRVNAGVWWVASSSGCAIGICPRGFGTVCVQWGTSPIPP